MKIRLRHLEEKFTIFSLLFFTETLDFKSLYVLPEGEEDIGNFEDSSPLSPILSLIQHGIFLSTAFLLFSNNRNTILTISRNKFLNILIILFLASFLWSEFPDFTLRRSISLLETTLFGIYLASRYEIKEQLKLLAISLSFSIVINILFTLIFPGYGIEHGRHANAWRGALEHKNFLGRLMTLSTIIFRIIVPETRKQSFLLIIGFIISFLIVILSTSKTALLSSLYVVFLLIPIYKSLQWNFLSATLFQSMSILIIGSLITIFIGNLDNISKTFRVDFTLTGRTDIWLATFYKLQEHPWLGYGYQGFWHGMSGPSADVLKFLGPDGFAPHSHNGFIELALATGLVGCTIFLISFFNTCKRALILATHTKTRDGLWILIYLSFLLISNQTEITLVQHNSIFWVIYVALAFSKIELLRNNN